MMPRQFEEFGFEANDIPHVDVVKVQTIYQKLLLSFSLLSFRLKANCNPDKFLTN